MVWLVDFNGLNPDKVNHPSAIITRKTSDAPEWRSNSPNGAAGREQTKKIPGDASPGIIS
jgi:hypothetical protein